MNDSGAKNLPPTADPLATIVSLLERIAERVDCLKDTAATEALDPASAARFIGISTSKLHELNGRGLIPAPVNIGDSDRLPRWMRSELFSWLRAGAPSRSRWSLLRDASLRKTG
jgi:predicted DNA-binding transcriptional regulator AlpA